MTRAEALALALLSVPVTGVVLPYVADLLGFGVAPVFTALSALAAAGAIWRAAGRCRSATTDTVLFSSTTLVTLLLCMWMAPSWLPPGGGPDLTHHLQLVDYIERHGTLVHDPHAAASIGEMAHYTPGFHLLVVIAGAISQAGGFQSMYLVVAASVALKFGVFALCLLRLLADADGRVALTVGGVSLLFYASIYTLGSFMHDSFLAQVVAELFAVAMWLTVIIWDRTASRWTMAAFALGGIATFLTWPIWIGPPLAALALLVLLRSNVPWTTRAADFLTAVVPIAVLAAAHTMGRSAVLSLVGTSGAVSVPSPTLLGWWLPAIAALGVVVSFGIPGTRPLIAFLAAVALQAAALFVVARRSGADTPYMAVKMTYLAVYPIAAAAMIGAAWLMPRRRWAAVAAAALLALAGRHVVSMPRPSPAVTQDLFEAGRWTREHVPAGCVDYLVGNEYTAYWLHLAVLGNPRSSSRSTDNGTYSTQASFARWIADEGRASHAIVRWPLLPAEIRDRSNVIHRVGDAAVLSRSVTCTN